MLSANNSSTTPGVILVVDDQEAVRASLSAMLRRLGYAHLLAKDGVEALEVYRRCADQVVLVILDLVMPRMSGREVLHELRSAACSVAVVLCSGQTEEEVAAVAAEGADGYLLKPVRLAALRAKIHEVLL